MPYYPPSSGGSGGWGTHGSGRAGDVQLAQGDIANLTTDLAAKLAAASNLGDLASAASARSNLGLGDLATLNRGVQLGRLNILGHSWAAGATLAETGTPFMEQAGLAARVLGLLAIHNDNAMNIAIAGSTLTSGLGGTNSASYGGWAGALQYLVPSNAPFFDDGSATRQTHGAATPGATLIVHGQNDLIRNTTSAGTQGVAAWTDALRTVLSRCRAGTLYKCRYLNATATLDSQLTNSGFTFTAQTTGNTGPGIYTSTANGNTMTFTIPSDFRGGKVVFCFIGGKNVYLTLTSNVNNAVTTIPVTASDALTSTANGDVIRIGSEEMLITSGGGTSSLTVTRAVNGTSAASHTAGDVIDIAPDTLKVTWSGTAPGLLTSPSPALGSGSSTNLSAQGYAGTRVPVVQRFTLTNADAGKTIIATTAGRVTSETYPLQFDSVWIESEYPPPVAIVNTPRFAYTNYPFAYTNAPTLNAATSSVVAEFDSNVKVVDFDAVVYGKSGTLKNSISSATSCTVTVNNPTTAEFRLGDRISIVGNQATITSTPTIVGSDYTFNFTPAATGTAGQAVSNANLWYTDGAHLSQVGHGVVAGMIYDAFASIAGMTSSQLGNVSATWTQDQRSGRLGIVSGKYMQPLCGTSTTTALAQNSVYWYPIDIPEECWITGWGVVTGATTPAAGVVRAGLYDSDYTMGRPGGLIAEFGTVAVATSSASYHVSSSPATPAVYLRVRPGRYWTAIKVEGGAVVLKGANNTGNAQQLYVDTPLTGTTHMTGYSQATGGAGALPATPTLAQNTTTTPFLYLRLEAAEFQ